MENDYHCEKLGTVGPPPPLSPPLSPPLPPPFHSPLL